MTAAPAAEAVMVDAAVPARTDGRKCWAKALTGVDSAERGGYALQGPWLDRGAVYRLAAGTLVVTCEATTLPPYRIEVTLWQVTPDADGGLAQVKAWTNKQGRIGPQIIKGIAARHKKAHPPAPPRRPQLVRPAPPRWNQRRDWCTHCRQPVPPGQGLLEYRTSSSPRRSYAVVRHVVCPPRRNLWPGRCRDCGGWVKAREGKLVTEWPQVLPSTRFPYEPTPRHRVRHHPECPPVPEPPPLLEPEPNPWPGPCEVCWQEVPARKGHLVGRHGDRHLVHAGTCPPNPLNPTGAPTWTLTGEDCDYPVGTVARVTLPDGPPEGPGWRELPGDGSEVSVIGVVIAVACRPWSAGHGDGVTSVWRVATDEEAAPVLAGERARLEAAGLIARARRLLALNPGACPPDAVAPPEEELWDLQLVHLPAVPFPAGAGRRETTIRLDEDAGLVWTVVHNAAETDDWSLSNYGGAIAYRHPLTEERRALISELRAHTEKSTH